MSPDSSRPGESSVSSARLVEKLRPHHPIETFDCGREELNRYLLRYAWTKQQAGAAQTYVGLADGWSAGAYRPTAGREGSSFVSSGQFSGCGGGLNSSVLKMRSGSPGPATLSTRAT